MKLLLPLFLLLAVSSSAQQVNAIIKKLKTADGKEVLVAAHRGDWRNAPENSLAAINYAIAMGVDIIEIDIQKTKDGQLVLMHDEKIDRTMTGKGKVSDYTLDSLKMMYLRNGCGVPTQHRIPTLEEAMSAMQGKVMVNLDKCYKFMKEAHAILVKTGTVDQAIFKGQVPVSKALSDYGALLSKVHYMPIVSLDDADAWKTITQSQDSIKPVAFEILFKTDTSAVLSKMNNIRQKGARAWVNSLWPSLNGGHYDDLAFDQGNTKDSWQWLIDKGFNVIQTDRPAALLAYLRKKGLHQ
jgi:glycerophosphoryl diester phosphodiesterase